MLRATRANTDCTCEDGGGQTRNSHTDLHWESGGWSMGWSGGGRSAQWPFVMREAASSQRRYEVQQARGGVTLTIELYRGPTTLVCVWCAGGGGWCARSRYDTVSCSIQPLIMNYVFNELHMNSVCYSYIRIQMRSDVRIFDSLNTRLQSTLHIRSLIRSSH